MSTNAITDVFTVFRSRLRTLAARIAGDDEADDVLHDAFCRLWERHPAVEQETEALRLSTTVVKNAAIDAFRRKRSHPEVCLDGSEDMTAERQDSDDIYDIVLSLSRQALSESQQRVFTLHDVEGLTYKETAEACGITEANARMILSRARRIIRNMYIENRDCYE